MSIAHIWFFITLLLSLFSFIPSHRQKYTHIHTSIDDYHAYTDLRNCPIISLAYHLLFHHFCFSNQCFLTGFQGFLVLLTKERKLEKRCRIEGEEVWSVDSGRDWGSEVVFKQGNANDDGWQTILIFRSKNISNTQIIKSTKTVPHIFRCKNHIPPSFHYALWL